MSEIRGARDRCYVNLGGGLADYGAIRFGFRTIKDSYKNIAGDLGVVVVSDTVQGVVYGINSPKPARVRISYLDRDFGGGSGNDNIRSVIRYAQYDNLNSIVLGGSINSKKVCVCGVEYDINSVTLRG